MRWWMAPRPQCTATERRAGSAVALSMCIVGAVMVLEFFMGLLFWFMGNRLITKLYSFTNDTI